MSQSIPLPSISICIPHYNRAKYLLRVLDSLRIQCYPALDVVIADDCSTDQSSSMVPAYIEQWAGQGPPMRYMRNARNIGYDANLRAALAMGKGDYLFVLGNDDALSVPDAMSRLAHFLAKSARPEVLFCNYHEFATGTISKRASATEVHEGGWESALQLFRRFSFVGGLAFRRDCFERFNTERYDGSVYFQIFLAARIIASGGRAMAIADSLVAKDVVVEDRRPDSYADTLLEKNQIIQPKTGGLDQVGRVAWEAIEPHVPQAQRASAKLEVFRQILSYSYAHWLLNYRECGSYRAALNLALGCRVGNLTRHVAPGAGVGLILHGLWGCVTVLGLLAPVSLLEMLRRQLLRRCGRM